MKGFQRGSPLNAAVIPLRTLGSHTYPSRVEQTLIQEALSLFVKHGLRGVSTGDVTGRMAFQSSQSRISSEVSCAERNGIGICEGSLPLPKFVTFMGEGIFHQAGETEGTVCRLS